MVNVVLGVLLVWVAAQASLGLWLIVSGARDWLARQRDTREARERAAWQRRFATLPELKPIAFTDGQPELDLGAFRAELMTDYRGSLVPARLNREGGFVHVTDRNRTEGTQSGTGSE